MAISFNEFSSLLLYIKTNGFTILNIIKTVVMVSLFSDNWIDDLFFFFSDTNTPTKEKKRKQGLVLSCLVGHNKK